MAGFTVNRITAAGESPSAEAGLPELFVESIRGLWCAEQSGEIWEVLAERRSDRSWASLGRHIVRHFAATARYVGLCADGSFPPETLHKWIKALEQSQTEASATVSWHLRSYPMRPEVITTEVSWNALYARDALSWLKSMWTDVPSEWLHEMSELILMFYQADVLSPVEWGIPLSTDFLLSTLGKAHGWVIPLDDNIGFLVGIGRDKPELRGALKGATKKG